MDSKTAMLDALRSIVQEVNAAADLQIALNIIVRRVRAVMDTEVCTVYLRDPNSGRYVFMANEGLNPSFVGKISLAADEGLVGQVATREEPLNLGRCRIASQLSLFTRHRRRVISLLSRRADYPSASCARCIGGTADRKAPLR